MQTRSAALRRSPRTGPTALLLACLASAAPTVVDAQAHGGQERPTEEQTATEGVDYRVYDRAGTPSSFAAIAAAMARAEVLLVGEEHDDMLGHAFEAALLHAAIERFGPTGARTRPVVLSLEMFERDVQYVLDEYLTDQISEDHFLRSARPWDDYESRYRPLVEAAKRAGVPVVAANAPRRYVNKVTRDGPESLASLSALARSYLPPLPYPEPSDRYRAEWDALMAEAMADATAPEQGEAPGPEGVATTDTTVHPLEPHEADEGPHGVDDGATEDETAVEHTPGASAIYAQALWDAAMGHAVAGALVEHLGALVVHIAGSFHVARGTGIPERIDDYRPGTRVTSVVITKADALDAWSDEDHADVADFVVLTRRPEPTAPTDPSSGR